jgi:uncharacterized protein YqgC (DUF456 family)
MLNAMLLASDMIDGGAIVLMFLILMAIVAAYAGVIWLSLWLTSKVNGSKALVWGAMLGVVTANFFPLLAFLLGQWGHISFLYESLLPSAVAASTLACIINLIIWKRKRKPNESVAGGNADQ